jgi:O-antigen ligase
MTAPQAEQSVASAKLSPLDTLTQITRWLGVLTPFAVVIGKSPSDIACTLIAALFLARVLVTRELSWAKQDWFVAVLVLWAYMVLRALFMPDLQDGLGVALPFIRYALFAVAMQTLVLNDPVWRRRTALAAAAALGLLIADALVQYVSGHDLTGRLPFEGRLTAFYHGPRVGIMIAWLALPAFLTLIDLKRYSLALGFALLGLVTIVLSGDRMALLLILLYAALFGLLIRPARRYVLIGAPAALVIAAAIFALHPGSFERQVLSTVKTIETLPQTQYGHIWKSALDIAAAHPLFGTGPSSFNTVCPDPRYGPLRFDRSLAEGGPELRCATHQHNLYLEWLSDTGLVGLCLFLAAMILILRRFAAGMAGGPPDWTYAGLFVLFIARLWPLTSATSFQHAWSGTPFWLVVGWGLAYGWEREHQP